MLDEPVVCLCQTSDALRIMLIHGTAEPQLTRELAQGGHDVLAVAAQAQAMRLLAVFDPHVILVATSDVARTCRELRNQAGADDCVSSPFHPAELTARIRAAIRRGAPSARRPRTADTPMADGAA